MSHYRRAGGGKRDANEPLITKRFAARGWHCAQLSGTAIPDLLCFPPGHRTGWLVDVKMPGKKATEAQVNEWTALAAKGIPVYVASTEADVDAIVEGTATAWEPEKPKRGKARLSDVAAAVKDFERKRKANPKFDEMYARLRHGYGPPRPPSVDTKSAGMGHALHVQEVRRCAQCRKVIPEWRMGMCSDCENAYTPPRSTPMDAPALAAETFAPCSCTREQPCAACSVAPPQCAVPSCPHLVPCPKHSLSALGRP